MDQDTRTYAPAAADLTAHCGARDDDYICTAAAGHAPIDHAAYESDLDTQPVHTWPAAAEQDPERLASIAALRQLADGYARLADAIEAHPAIPAPLRSSLVDRAAVLFCVLDAGEMAAAARAMPCTLDKSADDKWFNLTGQIGGVKVELYAARERVCTRRVVGTEKREVEVEVEPAKKRTEVQDVEIVEWDCKPVLAAAARTAVSAA